MQRMMLIGPGDVRWESCPDPVVNDAAAAIVRPRTVATCDIDIGALRGTYPLHGPYPFGHEGIAEVVSVGDQVRHFMPGDIVVVPFQISCGTCAPCRRGRTGNCASHPRMSTFGLGTMGGLQWGGLLADLALVPHADAMLVNVPPDVNPIAAASVSDNIPDAWRAVGPQLAADPAAEVLVIGGDGGPNSIGLYAVGIAVALGAPRVVYLDHDPERLSIAVAYGAEVIDSSPPAKAGTFPITVNASGTQEGLHCALNSTAPDGTCTSTSVYLTDPTLPMFAMYARCCTLHTGRAHVRPAIPILLELIRSGFDPSLVTTRTSPWDDAIAALSDPPLKLVLHRQ